MAIVFEANYSKKLGLPGYSSQQYNVTVPVELADINQVQPESERLYALLQTCVDRELLQTGYQPEPSGNVNGHYQNGHVGSNGSNDSKVSNESHYNGNGSNGNGSSGNGSRL